MRGRHARNHVAPVPSSWVTGLRRNAPHSPAASPRQCNDIGPPPDDSQPPAYPLKGVHSLAQYKRRNAARSAGFTRNSYPPALKGRPDAVPFTADSLRRLGSPSGAPNAG